MNNALIHLSPRIGLFLLTLGALGVSGCAADRDDLLTSASTAGTTAYLVHEEQEEDDYARARDFADARYTAIRRDAATGSGENLHTLATLLNASDPDAFGQWAQTNYATLFNGAQNRKDLVERIVAMRGMDARP